MKIIKIILHPYTVILSFLAILISGEQMGGFYVLYILLGLPHLAVHSVLGVLGIMAVLAGKAIHSGKVILYIVGLFLMTASLYMFFYNDRHQYNFETFHQVMPVITLFVFCLISAGFIFLNTGRLSGYQKAKK